MRIRMMLFDECPDLRMTGTYICERQLQRMSVVSLYSMGVNGRECLMITRLPIALNAMGINTR